ncbi:hypothetical protein N7532_005572 [Penicillium argentinense]|uniref:Uncharacterized protein n=1 Tax=Penicillium argentinense TaxID=1131581 RepID=A0A9W9FE72_9EURO|nr:uncharacterized protein N7532_005572 [Penicillium argentinense]KAJ5098571.1 hypothetical protein N7532_005572 [Penicillium argentinense]
MSSNRRVGLSFEEYLGSAQICFVVNAYQWCCVGVWIRFQCGFNFYGRSGKVGRRMRDALESLALANVAS